MEQFLKDRPREWLTFSGFRPTEVAVDRGYIGYKVIAQHRNSWQQVGGIIESKANLTTYCLEVSKQLGMRYISPSLPVNLTMNDNEGPLDDPLDLPVLGKPIMEDDNASDMAAISTGLRQRKGLRNKFQDVVRMAIANSKNR